jgi:hypothetical protein
VDFFPRAILVYATNGNQLIKVSVPYYHPFGQNKFAVRVAAARRPSDELFKIAPAIKVTQNQSFGTETDDSPVDMYLNLHLDIKGYLSYP